MFLSLSTYSGRFTVALLGIAVLTSLAGARLNASEKAYSGGAGSTKNFTRNAFSLPAANLSFLRQEDFYVGSAFYKKPWVIAPASTTARDGLGPLFNTNSCLGCHAKNGRGQPPMAKDSAPLSTQIQLSVASDSAADQDDATWFKLYGVLPEPVYGSQLHPRAVPGVLPEGQPVVTYTEIHGEFADGEPWTLLKPKWSIQDLNYGALSPKLQLSARVAPALVGLGLLAAIPEKTLQAFTDPNDADQDGISGRLNRVWSREKQQYVNGRFGLKANHPDIKQQSAAAFHNDLGINSSLYPGESCTASQKACQAAPSGGETEIPDDILAKVIYYLKLLGVPARRDTNHPDVLKGERLFKQAGCTHCHIPSMKTGKMPGFPELSEQSIQPFTDLLLHDMGEGLSDQRPDFAASGQEWRTPPLWGIGLTKTVSGHTRFLHDGRARNLQEAILWHGGEARAARDEFLQMERSERDALLRFLNSL
ncbi:MAG: thiol oxidoreductase [Proteobacteria bacterium]|nr:MAG: thiol oxidoreductase [Pseudomonadota bacterium]